MDEQRIKNVSLMLEFAVGGGMPPAASEMLQIHQDGRATYLAANAWPRNEAGVYQAMLSPAELKVLDDFLSEHKFFEMSELYGPVHSDSGFQILTLYDQSQEKKIKWGTFAQIPVPLTELQSRLSDIIETSREHRVQTIKAALRVVPDKLDAKTSLLECALQSSGVEPALVFLQATTEVQEPDFRVSVDTNETENAALVTLYYQAQPLRFVESVASPMAGAIKLLPGEEVKVQAPCPFVLSDDKYRLYGFLEFTMAVTLNDELTKIRCFVVTKSATE